jgi:hypothetical protein
MNSESLRVLTSVIDEAVDRLLEKQKTQQEEIIRLRKENQYLKDSGLKTLEQIEEYIAELESIRNHYANSNNHVK